MVALVCSMVPAASAAPPSGEKDPRWDRVDGRVRAMLEAPVPDGPAGNVPISLTIRPGTTGVTAVTAAVTAAGGKVTGGYADLITVEVPRGALAGLTADTSLGWIASAATPIPEVLGQGVAFMNADDWHTAGYTGDGVTIAIVDSGFTGYAALLGTDLPASVATLNYCSGGIGGDTDHGTGVAEIVHETAPDAELILVCLDDSGDLSSAVAAVDGMGAAIISMSLGFFNIGPGDGTLGFESIFADARSRGILWVNSVGNYAQEHWGGAFFDGDGDKYHQWFGTNEDLTFHLDFGDSISIYLKWDDWPMSDNDFDLELWRGATKVDESTGPQNGTQPPVEELHYTATSTATYSVRVVDWSAEQSPQLDLFVLNPTPDWDGLDTPVAARSLNDPGTSPLVVAAGAVRYTTSVIETYSSRGPTLDGRIKPNVTAPDGVANDTYGSFYGTSAAAPHVAGAAALLIEANPGISTTALAAMLVAKTRDGGGVGPDNTYGHGIIDLRGPDSQPVGLVDPTRGYWHLEQGALSFGFYFGNPGDYPFAGDWDCNGVDTPGLYRQSDGYVYLRNSNTQGVADITFFFGNPEDIPIIGDFDNDGCDTVSIYRPSQQRFYIINDLGVDGGGLGAADYWFAFGNPGDQPFAGDFDGDGFDEVGLHRATTGLVYYEDALLPNQGGGQADHEFFFGNPGDRFIAGDWNADTADSPAIYRSSDTTFYFRYTNTQGNADETTTWGDSTWIPISGIWIAAP